MLTVQSLDGISTFNLRAQPSEDSALNGVQVDAGDQVQVLERITLSDCSSFLHVKAGRKKGFIRAAYCVSPDA